MKRIILYIALSTCLPLGVLAQSDCSKKLKEAQLMLDRGNLYEIPAKLETCLSSGFTKEEKTKAYVLMTESYLYLGENKKAEETYLAMLKLKPLYAPYEDDPVEMHDYHERFTTKPLFNFPNIKTGFNRTYVGVINDYSLNSKEGYKESYSSMMGLDVGLGGDVNLVQGLYFSAYLTYRQKKFNYQSELLEDHLVSFNEFQQWLELPLSISFSPEKWKSKLTPYASVGFAFGFLLRSTAVEIRRENTNEEIDEKAITGSDVVLTSSENNQRKRNYNSAIFTIGAKYRLKEKYLALDVSYQYGFKNIIRTENQYNNQEMIYKYGYVDDDFRINNIAVSLTFINPIYFPRLKKAFKQDIER